MLSMHSRMRYEWYTFNERNIVYSCQSKMIRILLNLFLFQNFDDFVVRRLEGKKSDYSDE